MTQGCRIDSREEAGGRGRSCFFRSASVCLAADPPAPPTSRLLSAASICLIYPLSFVFVYLISAAGVEVGLAKKRRCCTDVHLQIEASRTGGLPCTHRFVLLFLSCVCS